MKKFSSGETERKEGPILSLRGVSKKFFSGDEELGVLDEIDLDVFEGEVVCLLGPSGCGKSTLLRLAAGFLFPDSGNVMLDGHKVRGPGADRGVVFQEDALFPWLTVWENIELGLQRRASRPGIRAAVARCLERVGLTDFRDYLPSEISGGMRQRVALARVLVLRPRMFLMDEPFGALDALTRGEMQKLFLALIRETGGTALFVTHDVEEAVLVSDRLLVMGARGVGVLGDIRVSMPSPRERTSPGFIRLCARVRGLLGAERAPGVSGFSEAE